MVTKNKNIKRKKELVLETRRSSGLSVDIVDINKGKKESMSVPKDIFGVPINRSLLAQAVRVYMANKRQQSAISKTRGEVVGSGRKIYRQKGTGNARHGDRYASIFVGGGKAHGPRKRTFSKSLNKKMKQKAKAMALTSQFNSNNILVIAGIEKIEPKTKLFINALKNITDIVKKNKVIKKTLIATQKKEPVIYRAGRNIKNITIREVMYLNTYEILNSNFIIFTKGAIEQLIKR